MIVIHHHHHPHPFQVNSYTDQPYYSLMGAHLFRNAVVRPLASAIVMQYPTLLI